MKVFTSAEEHVKGAFSPRSAPGPQDMIARPMAGRPDRNQMWSGYNTAWSIIATLLAGMVAWGGIGWLVDRLVGTENVFLATGLLLGTAGSLYLVYLRYGREDRRG